jgi:hypothetical protein
LFCCVWKYGDGLTTTCVVSVFVDGLPPNGLRMLPTDVIVHVGFPPPGGVVLSVPDQVAVPPLYCVVRCGSSVPSIGLFAGLLRTEYAALRPASAMSYALPRDLLIAA